MTATVHELALERAQEPTLRDPRDIQRIAGARTSSLGQRIGRITNGPFLTPEAKAQAKALRRELEQACSDLRRAGL